MKALSFLSLMLLSMSTITAQVYTVTSTADVGAGTLRSIITDIVSAGDTILFDRAINGDTIFLTSGEIVIDKDLTIIGNSADQNIIDGSNDIGNDSRLIRIAATADVNISHVSFINAGELTMTSLWGGALLSSGSLNLENCVFDNNKAYLGGAIRIQEGSVDMNACIFRNNQSAALGGAINTRGTTLRMTNCLLYLNASSSTGGAIHNELATMDLFNCTFADNAASLSLIHISEPTRPY